MAIVKTTVNIGDLKTPVEIQRFTNNTDEHGFSDLIWSTIATPRCKVDFDDRLIRQILRDDGVDSTIVKVFTMRYIPNITTKDRVFYKNTPYEIYSIQNLNEENRFMVVLGRLLEPTS